MTLVELQAKRESIIRSIGVARESFGERSVEYADAEKALALIDVEIRSATAASAPAGTPNVYRGTTAIFRQ